MVGVIGALYLNKNKLDIPTKTPPSESISFSLTKNINNWKLYEDSNKQFSFHYPNTIPNIKQKEPSRGYYEEIPTFVSEVTENVGGHPNTLLRIELKGPYPNSANKQIASYLEEKNLFFPKEGISLGETSEVERLPITIDSKAGILIKEKTGGSESYLIYFQTNLGIYNLSLFSSDSNEPNLDDFKNIIASFKFSSTPEDRSLPTGWYWTPSVKCGLQFPNPNNGTDIKGLTENEITRIFQWNSTFSLIKNNYLVSVEVLCSSNDKKFTTDTLVQRIEQIVAGNAQSQNRTIPSKILSKEKTNKWGHDAYVLTYDAGDFQDFYEGNNYVFATGSHTYSVRIVDKLLDPQTSDTIRRVFDNLKFE